MIVSWNELQRTCQKAFRGLGVPAGVDDDSSFAVLWLQARGLDALTPLDAALSALERAPPRPLRLGRRKGEVDVLDAGGQPAVSVASDALDVAAVRAVERAERVEVLITRVDGGIFIAGTLAQRPAPGLCARVQWWHHGTPRRLDVSSDGACRLCTVHVENEERNDRHPRDAVRIVMDGATGGRWMERPAPWCIDADHADLERRAACSVTLGINVADGLWTRLLELAKRTLVPATHASRERGAGGGEYND